MAIKYNKERIKKINKKTNKNLKKKSDKSKEKYWFYTNKIFLF